MSGDGFFLALEGGEGAGKSTLASLLAQRFTAAGRAVRVTREPGGTPAAEAIRALLLSDEMAQADPWCEALLFAAARADHVARVIRPALMAGALVICDRFLDSSVAYQGEGRGLGERAVRRANAVAVGECLPDLTVVLDVPPEIGLARASGRNRMEHEALDFHRRIREAFLRFAEREPQRYLVIDSGAQPQEVADQVARVVAQRWGAAS